jgi:hypothetical protein
MKSATESVRKAHKIRNFHALYAFIVCCRCPNIWFRTRTVHVSRAIIKKNSFPERKNLWNTKIEAYPNLVYPTLPKSTQAYPGLPKPTQAYLAYLSLLSLP